VIGGADLARYIDHTLLRPEATPEDIEGHCGEAVAHSFKAVCINPVHIPLARELLVGSEVLVCSVVGFPLGANSKDMKVAETVSAIEAGCDEIDMVLQVGAMIAGRHDLVEAEIRSVKRVAGDRCVKVILETSLLSNEQIAIACQIAEGAGADFVKTSTGFGSRGASIGDVLTMRQSVSSSMGVKASGGIATIEAVRSMLAAGANRIGTSAGVAILNAGHLETIGTY
jgi:deoxyribose-phosphate aldolase